MRQYVKLPGTKIGYANGAPYQTVGCGCNGALGSDASSAIPTTLVLLGIGALALYFMGNPFGYRR